MYLTFDRVTKQLISFSDILECPSNIGEEGIVFYNEFIIIESRPDISDIEVTVDDEMGIETIVPGQYELEEFKKNLVIAHEKRKEVISKAKILVASKIDNLCNGVDLGYTVAMKNIAEKIIIEKASTAEVNIFTERENILSKDDTTNDFLIKSNELLKEVNRVYSYFERFVKDVTTTTTFPEHMDELYEILENEI